MRSSSLVVMAGVIAVLILAVVWAFSQGARGSVASEGVDLGDIVDPPEHAADSREQDWSNAVAQGRRVEVPKEVAAPADPVVTVGGRETMGALSEAHREKLLETTLKGKAACEKEYLAVLRESEGMSAVEPQQRLKELFAKLRVQKYEAMLEMIESDDYWAFEVEGDSPTRDAARSLPVDWEYLETRNAVALDDGRRIDVGFAIDPSQYPGMVSTLSEAREVGQFMQGDVIYKINSMPVQDRMSAIRAHLAAKEGVEGLAARGLTGQEYEAAYRALKVDLIRGRFRIDFGSYMLIAQ